MLLAYAAVAAAAFAVSTLTLFSGFGLGTLLLPVFALFFPIPVAVAATAIVHVANNLFKLTLLSSGVVRPLLVSFGLPAVLAAFPGAWLLRVLSRGEPLGTWDFLGRSCVITPLGLVMGGLVLAFAAIELSPGPRRWRAGRRWLPLGGVLSGFFGGLSGHQGALRAVFLSPLGLTPRQFAATQAAVACMVDAARLLVYGFGFFALRTSGDSDGIGLVVVAIVFAFGGAYLGKRLLTKVTVRAVRILTGLLLVVVGTALASGIA